MIRGTVGPVGGLRVTGVDCGAGHASDKSTKRDVGWHRDAPPRCSGQRVHLHRPSISASDGPPLCGSSIRRWQQTGARVGIPQVVHWGWGGQGCIGKGGGTPKELGAIARVHGRRSAQKRRKKMGSSVAHKTRGTVLSQKMRHKDASGQATEGCNAVEMQRYAKGRR